MKFLVFTTDIPPLLGLPTSGTVLRTFGIIHGLRAHGHEVVVSVPETALEGLLSRSDITRLSTSTQQEIAAFKRLAFDSRNQRRIISEVNPEVIICGHWPAMIMPVKPTQCLVLDLAGPHLLERHYQGSPDEAAATLAKTGIIASADFVIVSGPSQRQYFLSFLARGNVPDPESKIITLTMPLSPELPVRSRNPVMAEDYPRFVFGGVFLPWQDPSWALRALVRELERHNRGTLTLIGGKHPNYDVKQGLYRSLFEDLAKSSRVSVKPVLPLNEFIGELGSADVALDLMRWNLERQLAVTIRSTTYLWSGVPTIYNDFADIGSLITQYDAGWTVAQEDEAAFATVISEIMNSADTTLRKSTNATRLAREIFSWDTAVKPLLHALGTKPERSGPELDIILDFPENAELPIFGSNTISQHFVCRANGLSRVECRIATHNRIISKPVQFRLFEVEPDRADNRKLITERTGTEESLENNQWFILETSPIQTSAGKEFVLEIEAPESTFEQSLSPWAVRSKPYPLTKLSYRQKELKHMALCLRTTCIRTHEDAT